MPYDEYLEEYTSEIMLYFSPGERFAIDTLDGTHIGNCSYYNYDEARGDTELGIMIGDREYWNNGYGTDAVNTLVDHIFTSTKLDRIYLKTLNWNERAQKCFTKCGFSRYGETKRGKFEFILMQMYRSNWLDRRATREK